MNAEEDKLKDKQDETIPPVAKDNILEEEEESGDAVEKESIPEVAAIERKPQNVWIDDVLFTPNEKKEPYSIALPGDTDARTSHLFDQLPNIKLIESEKGALWAETIRSTLGLVSFQDTFTKTLEDEEAEFHQTLEVGNSKIGSHEFRFKEKKNSVFDGELAVIRTISHLGMGSIYNTALYNSGIWVSFKPPSEEDLVELYRQLSSDQIEMGRQSYGLVYANTTSFTTARLTQFAMQHVYRFTADNKELNPTNALEHLSSLDINSLLWGLACTMFPRGFPYTRPCTANPEKCQTVTEETLNLRKLQFVNRRALTERQRVHMANSRQSKTITLKDIQTYQADMVRLSSHRIVVREGKADEISFNLKAPSIQEYVTSGHRWIDDMVTTVDEVLGGAASIDERNNQVLLRTRATIMRQYSHWVDSIEIDSNIINDRKAIEDILNNISADSEIRSAFIKGVVRYIEIGSVSVIGIPTYDCPGCGAPNEGRLEFPHKESLIPLDVIQLFFVLLTQKHRDLLNR